MPLRKFKHLVVLPFLGAVFDLKGGRFRTDGCSFEIPKEPATRPLRYRFLLHTYEARELKMVRQFVRPDDRVLELGGCLGVVSCVTNRRLRAPAHHVVVEPTPAGVMAMRRNREINRASFQIESCAVSGDAGGKFVLDSANITGGRLQTSPQEPGGIPVKSLRQLWQQHGPFDVLICDIEGGELEVFEQSADLFRSLRLVIVELHDFLISDAGVRRCQAVMREAGLELVAEDKGVEAWQRNPAATA